MKIISIFVFVLILTTQVNADSGVQAENEKKLYVEGNISYYFLPDQENIAMPTLGISYEDFYFEGRYNYEAKDAGSLWFGKTYQIEGAVETEITPMVGGIFGEIEGAAPGIELDADWRKINLYIEAEYVFDFSTRDENFFYSWSELTYGLSEWLRVGLAASRTRLYGSNVEIDRGPFIALSSEKISISCAALNIDDEAIVVINLSTNL